MRLNASTVEISGFGAPARTPTPTPARAKSVRVVAASLPAFASSSMTFPFDMARSNAAPPSICCFTAGPPTNVIETLWPLTCSNCGMSSCSDGLMAPALRTLISAAETATPCTSNAASASVIRIFIGSSPGG